MPLESLKRVTEITGKEIPFEKVDLLDKEGTDAVFAKVYPCTATQLLCAIHTAL